MSNTSFEKRFEKNPNEAQRIVKERTRLMGKMLVESCFYKLMPDGETRLIKQCRRKPILRGHSIYVMLDGVLRRCTLQITVVKNKKNQTEIYTLIPLDV